MVGLLFLLDASRFVFRSDARQHNKELFFNTSDCCEMHVGHACHMHERALCWRSGRCLVGAAFSV